MKTLASLLLFILCTTAGAGLPQAPEDSGYRWALILSADSPDPDSAQRMASLLVGKYGFTSDRVMLREGDRATLGEINKSMSEIYSKVKKNDTLLVVIDMPVVQEGGALFALPAGAQEAAPWTWLGFSWIREWLDATVAGRTMLIFPGCPQGKRSTYDDPVFGRFMAGKRVGSIDIVRACETSQLYSGSGRPNERVRSTSMFVPALERALMEGAAGKARIGGRQLAELMQRFNVLADIVRVPEYLEEGYRFIPNLGNEIDLLGFYEYAKDLASQKQALSALTSAARVDQSIEGAAVALLQSIALDPGARTGSERSSGTLSLRLLANQSLASIGTPTALGALSNICSSAADEATVRRDAVVQLSRRSTGFPQGTAAVRAGLDDPDPTVREASARGAVLLRDAQARDKLSALAQSFMELSAVRTAAIQALGAIQPERNEQTLLALVQDNDAATRLEAISALGLTQPSAATTTALLDRLWNDDSIAVRRTAASGVSRTLVPNDVDRVMVALTEAMVRGPDSVRQGAAYSLGQVGGMQAVAVLEDTARDNQASIDVRISALEALGEAAAGMDQATRETVTSTLDAATQQDHAGLRRAAATALGMLGTPRSTAVALRLVEDPDVYVRRAAQNAAVGLTVGELVEKQKSSNPELRLQAVRLLGQRPPKETVEPLIAAMSDESPLVREAAVAALARYRDAATTARVAKFLDSDSPRVRSGAAAVLGLTCDHGGLKPLLASVGGNGKVFSIDIVRGLGLCRSAEARDVVLRASKDSDPGVRRAAVVALGQQQDQSLAVDRLREISQQDESAEIRAAAAEVLKPSANPWETYLDEVTVDLVNDDHRGFKANVRRLKQSYPARPGYRIVDFKLIETSESRVKSKSVEIEDNGTQITLVADLEAGPLSDQYRGWLKARLRITQLPQEIAQP